LSASRRESPAAEPLAGELERLGQTLREVRAALGQRIFGQRAVVEQLLCAVLAEGHALLEGPPGLGKTTLVRCLGELLSLDFRRVQFTPDLMPADVIGLRVLEEDGRGGRHFVQHRGPLFTHLLLADEINRATPRTQSALLEAMQERQVTLFDRTERLERPFLVIATQNPIEMEGTYPLPEAQLDRFLARIEVDAPDQRGLEQILSATTGEPPRPAAPLLEREQLLRAQELCRAIAVADETVRRVARLVRATDPRLPSSPESIRSCVRYGASPRGGQAVLWLAKARALLSGRLYAAPEDVEVAAAPALRHRLILSYEGEARGAHPDTLVADALAAADRSSEAT
jgi:MoxR-like ATPase